MKIEILLNNKISIKNTNWSISSNNNACQKLLIFNFIKIYYSQKAIYGNKPDTGENSVVSLNYKKRKPYFYVVFAKQTIANVSAIVWSVMPEL